MVGVAGAFTLTPLFAHNQTSVLGQLLSPASSLHYDFDVHYGNVQVSVSRLCVVVGCIGCEHVVGLEGFSTYLISHLYIINISTSYIYDIYIYIDISMQTRRPVG